MSFEIWPAIDLKEGRCVRLLRGDMAEATVFNDDPGAQAAKFRKLGFARLHVVDLNGAFAGKAVNAEAVGRIRAATDATVQLGGGIRDMAMLESWLDRGITRAILGTAALKNPDFVSAAAKRHPGRVVVGIDARGGKVAVEGWAETSTVEAVDLARRAEDWGAAAIVHTDIDRDGAMKGANVEATAALARAVRIPVIASGGVSSLADIEKLVATRIVAGAIVGRALYDGALDAKAAIALAEAA